MSEIQNETRPDEAGRPAAAGSTICNQCGYDGGIETYLPSMSIYSDFQCPKCGGTDNHHNSEYAKRLRKAWNCKHTGTLVDAGNGHGACKLLKCTDCGSVGLDWSMRNEPDPRAIDLSNASCVLTAQESTSTEGII